MPKSVRIRLGDEVYAALSRRAAEDGVSVPELLRAAARRLAVRPAIAEWLERTRRRPTGLTGAEVRAPSTTSAAPGPMPADDSRLVAAPPAWVADSVGPRP